MVGRMTTSTSAEAASDAGGQHAFYPGLKGKSVLITGGASGIGFAAAKAFAAAGKNLTLLDISADALARRQRVEDRLRQHRRRSSLRFHHRRICGGARLRAG